MQNYFKNLESADNFEDMSYGFDFFQEYEVREVREIFNEEKIFSLEKIFYSSLNAQKQNTHILTFILVLAVDYFYFKKNILVLYAIGFSFVLSLCLNLFNSF